MSNQLEDDLCSSLDANPNILPFIPYLVQDLWALGSSPEIVIELISKLNLPSDETKILDLGCGKGAVTITLAEEFGYKAVGIDATNEFLDIAKQKAGEKNVSHLCDFQLGDIREYVKKTNDFDIVIYASLGGLLGNYRETMKKLRNTIKCSGYILIDDGYLKTVEKLERTGYEHYFPHKETVNQLTAWRDRIIEEIHADEESNEINKSYLQCITQRADELKKQYPEKADLFEWYVQNQKDECEVIDKYISAAIWLLKKAS